MNIEDSREKMIFRKEKNGKTMYSIGLSHKNQDGTWENGYMNCRFPKNTNIKDKTKIMILSAWIDFYVKDKVTHPYIFINKYDLINEENIQQDIPQNIKTEYKSENIHLTEDDYPF